MPEIKHELVEWGYTGALEQEGAPPGASVARAAGSCTCGAKTMMVIPPAAAGQQHRLFEEDNAAMVARHREHVDESAQFAAGHELGIHEVRQIPGCRDCALALSSGECHCMAKTAEHGPPCERMTVGCCGACVDEDRTPQPHVWTGMPGPGSARVECMRCGYVVSGQLPPGVAFCDRGRYLNHAYMLHRGEQSRRCAVCGGCWSCTTERFTLPLPGICAGSYECRAEALCEDCELPLPGEHGVYCEPCLAGYYRRQESALDGIERAGAIPPPPRRWRRRPSPTASV